MGNSGGKGTPKRKGVHRFGRGGYSTGFDGGKHEGGEVGTGGGEGPTKEGVREKVVEKK